VQFVITGIGRAIFANIAKTILISLNFIIVSRWLPGIRLMDHKPQAFKVGGLYRLETYRWQGSRVMEFLRKDSKGFLIFALVGFTDPSIQFEQKFKQAELLSVEEVIAYIV
jgi:hypothetical protein